MIDDKGLIQVVVVQATEDHVTEKIPANKLGYLADTSYGGGLFDREVTRGTFSTGTVTGVNSTLRGETAFTNTRRQKVSITSITDVTPVAEFRFLL